MVNFHVLWDAWFGKIFQYIGFFGDCRMAITHGCHKVCTLECVVIFNLFQRVTAYQNNVSTFTYQITIGWHNYENKRKHWLVYLGKRLLSCQLDRAACCGVIKGLAMQLCYEPLSPIVGAMPPTPWVVWGPNPPTPSLRFRRHCTNLILTLSAHLVNSVWINVLPSSCRTSSTLSRKPLLWLPTITSPTLMGVVI